MSINACIRTEYMNQRPKSERETYERYMTSIIHILTHIIYGIKRRIIVCNGI